MSCRLGPARRRRRSDLNRQQNRAVSPARFRSPRLPSPCEEQALRYAVSPRHLAHHGPRHQRLFDDPSLLVLAPTPSALDPEDLPVHLSVTLKLALKSHPSRRAPSQQGGRRRTDSAPVKLAKDVDESSMQERSSDPPWPRVMRRHPRGRFRSVDRGNRRPAIEPRNRKSGAPTLLS